MKIVMTQITSTCRQNLLHSTPEHTIDIFLFLTAVFVKMFILLYLGTYVDNLKSVSRNFITTSMPGNPFRTQVGL